MQDRFTSSMLRFTGVLFFWLFFSSALHAQPGSATVLMKVSAGSGQEYTIRVLGEEVNGVFHADVGSMARALRLGHSFNGSRMQIDGPIGLPSSSCLLSPGSSFMLVSPADGQSGRRILQLPSSPDARLGKLYLPVDQACRLFSLWLDRDFSWDAGNRTITATLWGERRGPSTRLTGLVPDEAPVETPSPELPALPETGPTVIEDIVVDTMANGLVIRFKASGRTTATSLLRPNESGIAYLTIPDATGNLELLTKNYQGSALRSITPVKLVSGGLQFTVAFDMDAFALKSSTFRHDPKNNDYVLYVMSDVNVEALRQAEKERQIRQQLSGDQTRWKLDAVVIDAGHGGKDPGAIGTRGTREKDVVLNVARDLGMFIRQKWPDVKVIYTRKEDRFIPLRERGRIANQFGGKLFVSIHCNAALKNHVRGAEVYILGTHKTQAALDLAMRENAVISGEEGYRENYKGFSDEYLIMSSMAQSAFAAQSTELAQYVQRRIQRTGSNNGLGVRQAGFMVLWTPSMPSILVEAGYLSNSDEESILRNREEQTKIAFGIFQGLQQYRSAYENRMLAAGSPG